MRARWDDETGAGRFENARGWDAARGWVLVLSVPGATRAIDVTAVNDAPQVTTTVAALAYTENDPATAVDSALSVSDVDSTQLTGATVSITSGFVSSEDSLEFTDQV